MPMCLAMKSSGRKRGSNHAPTRISTRNLPPRVLRPHGEIRRVQRGRSERMQRTSLRQRTVVIEKTFLEITAVRGGFAFWVPTASRPEALASAAFPVPPRRAHDTLQPQDESIIVGYYTSAEVPPPHLYGIKI